jgi:hypothetical protein
VQQKKTMQPKVMQMQTWVRMQEPKKVTRQQQQMAMLLQTVARQPQQQQLLVVRSSWGTVPSTTAGRQLTICRKC